MMKTKIVSISEIRNHPNMSLSPKDYIEPMKIKFKHWNCIAHGSYYSNGRKAVTLTDAKDHEPVATASVNLVAASCSNDCIHVKNYAENLGMTDALIKAGIIEDVLINATKSGYVTIGLYRLTTKALTELWKEEDE